MSRIREKALAPLLLSLLAVTALPATAAGSPDVDIESLEARMHDALGGWTLSVGYAIEIEDASPWDRFELVMRVTESDRPVLDAYGRPLEIAVPLTRPTEVSRDELEFENSLMVDVSGRSVRNPDRLRLEAAVVRTQDQRICDREYASIMMSRGTSGGRAWVGWQEPPRVKKVVKQTTRHVKQVRQVRYVRQQRIVRPAPVVRRTIIRTPLPSPRR
ncbi:MAG: hypothetical protein ABII12_00305 [Planctomycetota bacterium]